MRKKLLTELRPNEEGVIEAFKGGRGMRSRLRSIGLVEGARIRKLSNFAWHGPIVITVNRAQIGIGFGMARHILVRTF
jgi:ferrous iron transport protein A